MSVVNIPVNGLPTETLAHIFYLGTCDHDHLSFPVLASHVCRRWRNVAVGSPSLWTTITFSKHPPYERSKLWIERSKCLPIEIEIEVGRSFRQYEEDMPVRLSHVSAILDIIVPHIDRWRKLDVSVDQDMYMDNILTQLAQCASAPLLEILTLYNPFTPKSSLVPFHGNAPRLSYVTLDGVSIGWSSSLLHDLVEFQLDLTNLEIDRRPSWVTFSRILRDSPRLTHLELIHSTPPEPFTDGQDEPIELPSLENFSLMSCDPIYVSSLFRLLSMPHLKKLSLDLYERDFSEFICQLATPPRSVLSGLQYLKIEDLPCHSNTIKFMCEQLTNLKSIYLSESVYTPFFTTLTVLFNGRLYCPNLTTIATWGIPGQEMRRFITMRAACGVPIKRIVMEIGDALNEGDEKWLRENVQSFERFVV